MGVTENSGLPRVEDLRKLQNPLHPFAELLRLSYSDGNGITCPPRFGNPRIGCCGPVGPATGGDSRILPSRGGALVAEVRAALDRPDCRGMDNRAHRLERPFCSGAWTRCKWVPAVRLDNCCCVASRGCSCLDRVVLRMASWLDQPCFRVYSRHCLRRLVVPAGVHTASFSLPEPAPGVWEAARHLVFRDRILGRAPSESCAHVRDPG
jgi:hypothetical protein